MAIMLYSIYKYIIRGIATVILQGLGPYIPTVHYIRCTTYCLYKFAGAKEYCSRFNCFSFIFLLWCVGERSLKICSLFTLYTIIACPEDYTRLITITYRSSQMTCPVHGVIIIRRCVNLRTKHASRGLVDDKS